MIRIAHLGDLHVTEGPRMAEQARVLDWIVADATARGVELWLVGGDLTGTTVPHRATPLERNRLAEIFIEMAARAPVVIVKGNHDDARDVEIYRHLRGKHPIFVATTPERIALAGAAVFCLPYPSKGWALAGGAVSGDVETQREELQGGLRDLLRGWRLLALAGRPEERPPAIGLMHVNLGGSVVGGGEVMIGREIELSPHDLTELGFDAGFLSHIHRAQEMAPGWHYAGAPYMLTHGEESYTPGYVVAEIAAGVPPVITHVATPSRRLVTVEARWTRSGLDYDDVPDVQDAEVRLRFTVPEDARATVGGDVETLTAMLTEAGAAAVKVDVRLVPFTRVRSEAIATATTLRARVVAFFDSLNGKAPSEAQRARCLMRLDELEAAA